MGLGRIQLTGRASRPAWARGLKRYQAGIEPDMRVSRPAWARGLKLLSQVNMTPIDKRRAPRGRVD